MNSIMNLLVTQTLKPLILKEKILSFRKDKESQFPIISDKSLKMKPLIIRVHVYNLSDFSEFAAINMLLIYKMEL